MTLSGNIKQDGMNVRGKEGIKEGRGRTCECVYFLRHKTKQETGQALRSNSNMKVLYLNAEMKV